LRLYKIDDHQDADFFSQAFAGMENVVEIKVDIVAGLQDQCLVAVNELQAVVLYVHSLFAFVGYVLWILNMA
jgi:hypothetical protein